MKNITIHTWIIIGFPLYLIGFELMLRNLFNVEISSFIGPSLGASGIGFLLECIKPKKVIPSTDLNDVISSIPKGYTFRDERDEKLVVLSWVYILVCSAIWVYICSASINHESPEPVKVYDSKLFSIIGLGTFNYIVGVGCLFAKENKIERETT